MSIDLPDIPLGEFEIPESIKDEVEDESGGSTIYAFLGSGQAGGRIVEAFYKLGYKKVLCINTAENDLNTLEVPEKQRIHLDIGTQGAGKDMEKGERAASEHQQEIWDHMQRTFGNVNRIIVCAGLGGGTGGGSILVLLDLARKYLRHVGCEDPKKHVGAIVTLPKDGEVSSPVVAVNAQAQIKRLTAYAKNNEISPLLIIDNDKINRMYPKLTVKSFWPTVNATIAGLFHTFNIITTQDSQYSTFDPADYSSIMSAGGCMIMGLTNINNFTHQTDISHALKTNLEKTLLADGFDLKTARAAAVIAVGSTDLFENQEGLMASIEYGFDTISALCGNAIVHRGIYETKRDKFTVYTLISGLDAPLKRIQSITRYIDQT